MINKFFFTLVDQEILLSSQRQLEHLKLDASVLDENINELISLLRAVSSIPAKETAVPEHKIASWLFMADVYGTLSCIYSHSPKQAEMALDQALECADSAKTIIKKLPVSYELDIEFIKKCNTFNIANVEEAMDYIEGLISYLLTKNDEPLFRPIGPWT